MSAAAAVRKTAGTGHLQASVQPRAGGGARGSGGPDALRGWEELATEAVGNVIEFWGFKRNQGRVWGLLYLRDQAMTAGELQGALGLSKGAVSMLLRDLETWDVVRRVRRPRGSVWLYEANTDFMAMIGKVLMTREVEFLRRVRADLSAAVTEAERDPTVSPTARRRLRRMSQLARRVEDAVDVFRRTAQLDLRSLAGILSQSVRKRFQSRSKDP